MTKKNLVYVWSLRNAAADKAGQADILAPKDLVWSDVSSPILESETLSFLHLSTAEVIESSSSFI